jgi:hypothetical protein
MQLRVFGTLPTPAAARDAGLDVDVLSRGAIEGR